MMNVPDRPGIGDDDDDERTQISKPSMRPVIPPKASAPAASLVIVGVPHHIAAAQADLGRRVPLPVPGELIVGRSPGTSLYLDQEDVSRKHARVAFEGGVWTVTDLDSTNGTSVNGNKLSDSPWELRDGDRIDIGSTILKFIVGASENEFHEVIYRMKVEDALTQIHNKRYLMDFLGREVARVVRHGASLSFVLFDIDHFKKINDTHGHLAGDMVLRELAAVVKTMVRKEECFARYGGEEFAIVQPDGNLAGAAKLAEKVRAAVERTSFVFKGTTIPVTVSLGVAQHDASMNEPAALIAVADARLYAAKNSGRNRVVSTG